MNSLTIYTIISLVVTIAVVAYAIKEHAWQYYYTSLFLVKSKVFSILCMNNTVLASFWGFFLLRQILFGSIRNHEWEGIAETMSYQTMHLLFSISYFKVQITQFHVLQLFCTLCSSSLHLLARARLDTVEQSDEVNSNRRKLAIALFALTSVDILVVRYHWVNMTEKGSGISSVFLVEWSLNLLHAIVLSIKIALHELDQLRKMESLAINHYLTLFHNFFHCVIELLYFCFLFKEVGIPVHFFREIYIALRGVVQAVNKALTYRKQCSIIESFEDPQLSQTDEACVICMESLSSDCHGDVAKKLPCGHIFHAFCLFRFIEKDTSCPMCRRNFIQAYYRTREHKDSPIPKTLDWRKLIDETPLEEEKLKFIRADIQRSIRLIRTNLGSFTLPIEKNLDAYLPSSSEIDSLYVRYVQAFTNIYNLEMDHRNSFFFKIHSLQQRLRMAFFSSLHLLRNGICFVVPMVFELIKKSICILFSLGSRSLSVFSTAFTAIASVCARVDRELFTE
ncbi:ubiquitin-protein ligase synoviolin [Perkinsela sp. CCAP 1560/4]|nr:ubiquitin-protein ligase synoviolin [Perkinsela sp. CCAP 1560/4]|eukprot:KNH05667.1 ubiquitin-protein ligase synoviolin [Perkinsela sp. CCAP 1560/4]